MGKLGFDIVASHLSETDLQFAKEAVSNYHSFKNIVWHGNLYRLLNPHENEFASVMYVNGDKSKAIIFNYLVDYRQRLDTSVQPIKLDGLDPSKKYTLKEINLYPGSRSWISTEQVYSGDFLMKVGINPLVNLRRTSVVLEVNEVK
jgi:alpha-galactosidase